MAKPAITVPTWATNTNYSVGPDDVPGTPTKVDYSTVVANGHIPAGEDGDPNPNPSTAQHMNDFQNRVAQTCQWVLAGSSSGAADAHIVETDSNGRTTVKAVQITGPAAGSALSVAKVTSLTNGLIVSGTGGTITAHGSGDAILFEVGGSLDGILVSVTGDHVPYAMSVQTTAPTSFYNDSVPLFARQFTGGGNTSVTLNTAIRATREYVPTYANQHVRAYGTGGTVTADTTEVAIIDNVSWPSRKALQASNVPILYTASFDYEAISTTIAVTARVYNGATLIHTSHMFIESATQEGSHIFRGVTTGTVAGELGDFSLTIETSSGTCSIKTSVLTVETAN